MDLMVFVIMHETTWPFPVSRVVFSRTVWLTADPARTETSVLYYLALLFHTLKLL